MSFDQTACLAYGFRVPVGHHDQSAAELVDGTLADPAVKSLCPDVGHLEAGTLNRKYFFLVTACESADLGSFTPVDPTGSEHLKGGWDSQLRCLLVFLGWHRYDLEPPGWFLVCDEN